MASITQGQLSVIRATAVSTRAVDGAGQAENPSTMSVQKVAMPRRNVLLATVAAPALTSWLLGAEGSHAAMAPQRQSLPDQSTEDIKLCTSECESKIEEVCAFPGRASFGAEQCNAALTVAL